MPRCPRPLQLLVAIADNHVPPRRQARERNTGALGPLSPHTKWKHPRPTLEGSDVVLKIPPDTSPACRLVEFRHVVLADASTWLGVPFGTNLECLVLILDRRPLSLLVIGAAYGLFKRKTSTIVIVTRDPREELSPALDMFGQDVDGMITHEHLDIGSTPCLDFKRIL